MYPLDPLAGVDSQSAVDEMLSMVPILILALKSRRNEFSAISKLPAELLVKIFLELQEDRTLFAGDKSWLNITKVCHQWRNVALSTPLLWRSIDLTRVNRDAATSMLRRSQSLPLRIRYAPLLASEWTEIPRRWAAAEVVMTQVSRLQELEIRTHYPVFLTEFLKLFAAVSAPRLEILRLSSRGPGFTVSNNVFQHDMPSLRVLEIDGGTLGPELPPSSNLTHLAIASNSAFALQGIPVSALVSALQNMPNIEEITISHLVSDMPIEQPPVARVSLPNLSHLWISSSDISGSAIFQCLDYPRSTRVHFVCSSEILQGAQLAALKIACSHFTVGDPDSSHFPLISGSDPFQIAIYVETSSQFNISLPLPSPEMMTSYLELCSSLNPITTALSLLLCEFSDMDPIWHQVYHPFMHVQILRLHQCCEGMVEGLLGTREGTAGLRLPKLQTIHFDECGSEAGPEPSDVMLAAVKKVLRERSSFGVDCEVYWDGACIADDV